jgi:hypothetical protein
MANTLKAGDRVKITVEGVVATTYGTTYNLEKDDCISVELENGNNVSLELDGYLSELELEVIRTLPDGLYYDTDTDLDPFTQMRFVRGHLGLRRKNRGNIGSLIPGAHGPILDYSYIAQHYTGRESIPVIARALNAHPDSIRRILRDNLHLVEPQPKNPLTPEQRQRADDMLDGTITYAEVAKTLGLTRNQLAWAFPNRGLKQENMGMYRSAVHLAEELGV